MTKQKYIYQQNLSLESPILLNESYKQAKVAKMLAILRQAGVISDNPVGVAIDLGCSGGFFTSALAPYCNRVVGVDIDPHALRLAVSGNHEGNLAYLLADSMRLPLADSSIDLIVCNHVYEHVPVAEQLFLEIWRVLKPEGRCYLGAASRLTVMEPHYHLPFLSWLPKPVANLYMRLSGKGTRYYENLRTYWGIRTLIGSFTCDDYTLKVIGDPDKYHARDLLPRGSLLASIPLWVWRLFYPFLPTYILILRKRAQ